MKAFLLPEEEQFTQTKELHQLQPWTALQQANHTTKYLHRMQFQLHNHYLIALTCYKDNNYNLATSSSRTNISFTCLFLHISATAVTTQLPAMCEKKATAFHIAERLFLYRHIYQICFCNFKVEQFFKAIHSLLFQQQASVLFQAEKV